MRRVKVSSARNVARRIAPVACVAMLGVGAAACGSSSKTGTHDAPTATTAPSGATVAPSGATTAPATTAPATTAPQSGGAGF